MARSIQKRYYITMKVHNRTFGTIGTYLVAGPLTLDEANAKIVELRTTQSPENTFGTIEFLRGIK